MSIADAIHEEGRVVGLAQGRLVAPRSQLIFKFKLQTLDERYEARLKTATPDAIDRYWQRVLVADSLAAGSKPDRTRREHWRWQSQAPTWGEGGVGISAHARLNAA
jgi:hypothetical protein